MQAGEQIDVWVVDEPIGTGGMASVYRCHNRDAPRILAAVKVLERSLQASESANARFVREAEILFHLDHPNVVQVRNVRMGHDPPFIEMEFIEGESLESRLRLGGVDLDQAMSWIAQIANAVAYLHGKGVRHRDIKPANLLIDSSGHIKLVDFGLATETGVAQITREGIHFGTVAYAPPEWVDPDILDPVQWDLYATGVVVFELLTGKRAFPTSGQGPPRKQALQVMVAKQEAAALDPGPQFPDQLRALIRRLTHRNPASRPSSANEICREVREIEAFLARGKWHPPDEAAIVEAEASMATAKPAPSRSDVSTNSVDVTPPQFVVEPGRSWLLYLGVGAAVALGFVGVVGLAGLSNMAVELEPAELRDVDLAVEGLPLDVPAELSLAGRAPAGSDGTTIHFEGVPFGPADLKWVVGEGCTIETCPGEDCGVGCGFGFQALEIVEGDGSQSVDLLVEVPLRKVILNVPSLEGKGGLFKKRPDLRISLDGVWGRTADGYRATFYDIVPGAHEVVATIGTCGADAIGCWPKRECPEGCRSKRLDVDLEWKEDDAILTIALPLPD